MKRVSLISLLLVILILVSACSKSVAGRYKQEGAERYIELKDDGTFTVTPGISYFYNVSGGRYDFKGGGNYSYVRFLIPNGGTTQALLALIMHNPEALNISDPNTNKEIIFTKVLP